MLHALLLSFRQPEQVHFADTKETCLNKTPLSSARVRLSQRDVIVRFGRHPHRNEVLGRELNLEELDYVASGRLVHTRPIPQRQQ